MILEKIRELLDFVRNLPDFNLPFFFEVIKHFLEKALSKALQKTGENKDEIEFISGITVTTNYLKFYSFQSICHGLIFVMLCGG